MKSGKAGCAAPDFIRATDNIKMCIRDRVNAALAKQQSVREKRSQESTQIRVAAHKLDELINLVGELVISAAGAQLRAQSHGCLLYTSRCV